MEEESNTLISTKRINFEDFDKLNLEPFADRLLKYLDIDRHFMEKSLVISLNGQYGCGKTTFFEMLEDKVRTEDQFSMLKINAWETDYQQDALLSILYELVKFLDKDEVKSDTDSLKESAKKIFQFGKELSSQYLANKLGINPAEAERNIEKSSPMVLEKNCFELFEERRKSFDHLKKELEKFASQLDKPLIIVIDELDRCRPDYTVEYLEVMKHLFDLKNLVFILGVDRDTLQSSVECMFGSKINFEEYYRKFSHRQFTFPTNKLHSTTYHLNATESKELKLSLDDNEYSQYISSYLEENHNFCELLKPTPRQIIEILRIISHLIKDPVRRRDSTTELILIYIKVLSSEFYHKIGNNSFEPADIKNFLVSFGIFPLPVGGAPYYHRNFILFLAHGLSSESYSDEIQPATFTLIHTSEWKEAMQSWTDSVDMRYYSIGRQKYRATYQLIENLAKS